MKLLTLIIMSVGLNAFAADPNNDSKPKHLDSKFKGQTCAFSAKSTAAQKLSTNKSSSERATR